MLTINPPCLSIGHNQNGNLLCPVIWFIQSCSLWIHCVLAINWCFSVEDIVQCINKSLDTGTTEETHTLIQKREGMFPNVLSRSAFLYHDGLLKAKQQALQVWLGLIFKRFQKCQLFNSPFLQFPSFLCSELVDLSIYQTHLCQFVCKLFSLCIIFSLAMFVPVVFPSWSVVIIGCLVTVTVVPSNCDPFINTKSIHFPILFKTRHVLYMFNWKTKIIYL